MTRRVTLILTRPFVQITAITGAWDCELEILLPMRMHYEGEKLVLLGEGREKLGKL